MLHIKEGLEQEFEDAFRQAAPIISGMKGYITHSLSKCMEETHKYLLLVEWETLEDHTEGFRGSSVSRVESLASSVLYPVPDGRAFSGCVIDLYNMKCKTDKGDRPYKNGGINIKSA